MRIPHNSPLLFAQSAGYIIQKQFQIPAIVLKLKHNRISSAPALSDYLHSDHDRLKDVKTTNITSVDDSKNAKKNNKTPINSQLHHQK